MEFLTESQFEHAKESCMYRINVALHHAQLVWPEKLRLITMPKVEFSNKMQTCAGRAWTRRNLIKLSSKILRLNGLTFIEDVPVHELAHIIADKVHKANCHHDYRWKNVMKKLGHKDVTRCHKLKTGKYVSFRYTCGCTEEMFKCDYEESDEITNLRMDGKYMKRINRRSVKRPKITDFPLMTHMKIQEKPRTCRSCKQQYALDKKTILMN